MADRQRKKSKKEEEAKKEEERKKAKELEAKRHDAEDTFEYLKLFAIDIGTEVYRYANREPTNFLLICCLIMLLYVNWRIGSLQNQVYYLQQAQEESAAQRHQEYLQTLKDLLM